ncbi:MAG: hypothetical protein SFV53_04205 [Rickettsiales bacterium]|nr:hypothetical protein [Rickettsiales bacterium]
MTEKTQQNQDLSANISSEIKPINRLTKKNFLTGKILFLVVLLIIGYFGFNYFAERFLKKESDAAKITELDNLENEIFDLSQEYKKDKDSGNIDDFSLNEIKGKGIEFIYRTLLKNQLQINDLKEQNQTLRDEFLKYKNQQKLAKIIFAYVELRQKIFTDETYQENYLDDLQNFEMLTLSDQNLQDKLSQLKPLLKNFSGAKNLNENFTKLIPEIIVTKNNSASVDLVSKIRRNIAKLIIIRRIDGKNPNDVDGIVARAEKFLQQENYQEAFNALLALDQNYHAILVEFLDQLNTAIEIKKIDAEILSYLKTLS